MPQNDARCAAAPSQWPSLFPNDLPHSQMALLIPKWPVLTTHVAACCGLAQLNFFRDVSDPSCRACGFSEAYQVCKKCPFGSSLDASAASVGLDACSCNGGFFSSELLLNMPCAACPVDVHGVAIAACPGGLAPPRPLAGHWLDVRYAVVHAPRVAIRSGASMSERIIGAAHQQVDKQSAAACDIAECF